MTVPSEDHPVPETSKDKPTSSNTLSDYELKPPSYDESTGDPSNPSKSDNPSNSGNPIDPTKLSESFASDPLFKNKFPFDLPYCEELFLDNSKFKDWITNNVKPVKTYEPNNKESVEDYPIYFQKKCFNSALYQCYDKLNKGYNGKDLEDVLNKAWDVDQHMTLKIIWNTRSIKDGKGEKWLFYRCCGWLREYHPVTLIRNLAWVVRPVIKKERSVEETTEKTIGRKAVLEVRERPDQILPNQKMDHPTETEPTGGESNPETVRVTETNAKNSEEVTMDEDSTEIKEDNAGNNRKGKRSGGNIEVRDQSPTKKVRGATHPNEDTMDLNDECLFPLEFDVDSGLSHGYWKDLLHILQLAATKKLNCTGDPQKNLYGAKRLAKTQKDKKKFNVKKTKSTPKKKKPTPQDKSPIPKDKKSTPNNNQVTPNKEREFTPNDDEATPKKDTLTPRGDNPAPMEMSTPEPETPKKPGDATPMPMEASKPGKWRSPRVLKMLEEQEKAKKKEFEKNHGKNKKKTPIWRQNSKAQKLKQQKDLKHSKEKTTRDNLAEKLENNPFYRALHLTVARIFSDQLRADLETVNSSHPEVSSISFAAKWAPSLEKMHDRSTLIATTIAEHRFANIPESNFEREIFLRFARERYRRELSVLRKKYPVEIAEENISVKQSQDYPDYKTIDYDNMPDIAMGRYKALFANRDLERFTVFLDKLAEKRAKEAVNNLLLPSQLAALATQDKEPANLTICITQKQQNPGKQGYKRQADNSLDLFDKNIKKQKQDTKEEVPKRTGRMVDGYIKSKMLDYEKQLADVNSQWITLVGEVRAHGKLDKCFAAIDFSTKTMCQPKWYDGTVPRDTAIALAMLMAEVNTSDSKKWCVSLDPSHLDYQPANATGTFEEKASRMNANKPETTKIDIKHVFDHLLNFAICNKIKKEDVLKRIFVITGQSLEEAEAKIHGDNKWKACRDKIELAYKEVGYEMPELIYWNLRGRLTPHNAVKKEDGITFITGCSQAMIKVLIETGDIAVKHTHGKYYLVGKDEDILMARQRPDAINEVKKIAKSEDYRMLEIHD